jgi:hypothetical protein
MTNPFKPEDRVQTKVKGSVVDAVVRLVWKDEVQVRTGDNELLWRSVKTVWLPSVAPQAEPANDTNTAGIGAAEHIQPSMGVGETPAVPAIAPNSAGEEQDASTDTDAGIAAASSDTTSDTPEPLRPGSVRTPSNITSCGAGEAPLAKRKARRRK